MRTNELNDQRTASQKLNVKGENRRYLTPCAIGTLKQTADSDSEMNEK